MKHDDIKNLIQRGVLQGEPDKRLVQKEIKSLVGRGFIRSLPNKFFEFDNNLTWEVVYETLLFAERRRLHALVAEHIELCNQDELDGVADVLAHHYEKAQNINKCIWYSALAGKRAAEMYANEDALSNFNKALEMAGRCNDALASDFGVLNERVAEVYETIGKYQEAINCYRKSLGFAKNNHSKRKSKILAWTFRASTRESELCRKIAISFERQSKYKDSIHWLDAAEDRLPNRPGFISSQIAATRCVVLYRMGEYRDSLQWGKRALRHAKKLKRNVGIAYAHNMMGSVYMVVGEFDKATMHWSRAVQYYQELGDYSGIASANCNMGCVSMLVGDLNDAITYYDIALTTDKRVQNDSSIAMDHTNLGEVLVSKGDMEKASEHLGRVLDAYDAGLCPPDLTGMALVNLCRCELSMGEIALSEEYIQRGLRLIRETGQKWLLAEAELQSVEVLIAQGKIDEAVKLCQETMKIVVELDAKPLQARGERIMASALIKRNELDQAYAHAELSVSIARDIGAKQEEGRGLVMMVNVSRELKEPEETMSDNLYKAISIFSNIGADGDLAVANEIKQKVLH